MLVKKPPGQKRPCSTAVPIGPWASLIFYFMLWMGFLDAWHIKLFLLFSTLSKLRTCYINSLATGNKFSALSFLCGSMPLLTKRYNQSSYSECWIPQHLSSFVFNIKSTLAFAATEYPETSLSGRIWMGTDIVHYICICNMPQILLTGCQYYNVRYSTTNAVMPSSATMLFWS